MRVARKFAWLLALPLLGVCGLAQQDPAPQQIASSQQVDPLKRPLTEKQRQKSQRALYKELSQADRRWLDEDVVWIITPEEREAFLRLSNEQEREQFIEQVFWPRRDPNPDTEENEYRDEHYRRIAYANEHFASGVPGWRTDRGRMYIMHGPPDEIDAHPSGGRYERPPEEGGGTTSTYPFEVWRYRDLDGIGQEVEIEFVDVCGCNDYHMTIDRSEKDALVHTPGGLTTYEEMGLARKADRLNNGLEALGQGPFNRNQTQNEFERLDVWAKLQAPPRVKVPEWATSVDTKLRYSLLPLEVQADFVKLTADMVLVPITIQISNRDVTFVTKDGIARAVINVFGRLSTLSNRSVQTFEDSVKIEVPADLLAKTREQAAVYWKALPVRAARYRLDIVVKDVNGDRMGTWGQAITVPEFGDERLAASSLILADQLERLPARNPGTGNFVIGDTKVRPRLEDGAKGQPAAFRRDEKMNFWLQIYNLATDQQTKKPSASVEYEIVNLGNNKQVVHAVESTDQMGNIGDQLTLQKSMPLSSLEPGLYQITVKVDDKVAKQSIAPMARFSVK